MKIKVDGLDDKKTKALQELSSLLKVDFCKTKGDVSLSAVKVNKNGRVLRNGDQAQIYYCSDSEFFRGVLALISNKESIFEIGQKNAFKTLSVMLDLSRNAVCNIDFLKEFVRHCALLGYTEIQLYTEDTYEIEGHPYFGYMRGRLTCDEIKEVDRHCALFGIELVPCIQTLAHLSQITRYEDYKDIIDCNDILLIGEEKTYALIDAMFSTLSSCYTSRKVNIGMDEAHMVGLGKYLDKNGYKNRFEIMETHLLKVASIAKKYGFSPSMWSDMFFRLAYGGEYYPKEDQQGIPPIKVMDEVELIYWDYYHTDYNHYDRMIKLHKKLTDKISFAGGAWKWVGFTPWNYYSAATGKPAIKACIENSINAFTVTCWSDNGAECAIMAVLPSLYFYAQHAYGENDTENVKFKRLTGITFEEFMALDSPVRHGGTETQCNNSSKFFLYNDPLLGTFNTLVPDESDRFYQEKSRLLMEVEEKAGRYSYLFKVQRLLCDVLELKCDLGVKIRTFYQAEDKEALKQISRQTVPEIILRLEKFIEAFMVQWSTENKTFGAEVQLSRLGGVIERLKFTISYIESYISGERAKLDILEEEPLPLSKNQDLNTHIVYSWGGTITTSVI